MGISTNHKAKQPIWKNSYPALASGCDCLLKEDSLLCLQCLPLNTYPEFDKTRKHLCSHCQFPTRRMTPWGLRVKNYFLCLTSFYIRDHKPNGSRQHVEWRKRTGEVETVVSWRTHDSCPSLATTTHFQLSPSLNMDTLLSHSVFFMWNLLIFKC